MPLRGISTTTGRDSDSDCDDEDVGVQGPPIASESHAAVVAAVVAVAAVVGNVGVVAAVVAPAVAPAAVVDNVSVATAADAVVAAVAVVPPLSSPSPSRVHRCAGRAATVGLSLVSLTKRGGAMRTRRRTTRRTKQYPPPTPCPPLNPLT